MRNSGTARLVACSAGLMSRPSDSGSPPGASSPGRTRALLLSALLATVALGCAVGPPPPDLTGGTYDGGGYSCDGGVGGAAPAAATALAPTPWLHVEGNQIKDPTGKVVILRGVATADLGAVQAWEGGVNKMIDRLTNAEDTQGCSPGWHTRVIRFTITPKDGDTTTPTQYQAGGDYYDKMLRPAVDYAHSKGLYVIIDWHYIDDTTKHRETTSQFWTEMAPRFANDSHVLFELFNEPINGSSWPSVRADMQIWANIVRAAAPKNLILVGTPNWCQVVGPTATMPIEGTNIVYVAHMYPQHWAQPGLRNQIVQAAAVHPVFVTEWGFQEGSNAILNGTASSYGYPFKQFIEENKLSWIGWVASSSWQPVIFTKGDYRLLVGEGWMGGFLKDWLYERRADDQPSE